MFFIIYLNYILGYVRIRVESFYLERFLNICISKKILLWRIKREKSSILYANISIRDYKKIRKIAKRTKSIIKLEAKKGLPFIIHKYVSIAKYKANIIQLQFYESKINSFLNLLK